MSALNDCGCCEGLTVETPAAIGNRPGLSAIAYRIGTHAQFKASMLARLSSAGFLPLAALKARDDDDFTVALLDAWAVVGDILTFYQERIANESYLRTATERASVINLARLIGYELRPGVAATTYLAFTLESGPGAPAAATLDVGLKVQSLPGPGEKPQTFETVEVIEARPDWNELKPQRTELRMPKVGDTHLSFAGVTTNLRVGDPILFAADDGSDAELLRLTAVEPDTLSNQTLVRWSGGLTKAHEKAKVYALRLRASLFGYNAPLWGALPIALRDTTTTPKGIYYNRDQTWAEARLDPSKPVHLDAVYPQVVKGSWIVVEAMVSPPVDPHPPDPPPSPTPPVYHFDLYKVRRVTEEAVADFNISAKATRLELSSVDHLDNYSPRNATVFAQSEELTLAESPKPLPIKRDAIELDRVVQDLKPGRTLIVTGKVARTEITTAVAVASTNGVQTLARVEGSSLRVVKQPTRTSDGFLWRLEDHAGLSGFIAAETITFVPSLPDDPDVSEVVTLKEAQLSEDGNHTVLTLVAPLKNAFDLATVTIAANVAFSTHGESVHDEVLGSGDAGKPYQSFTLHNAPLTFTPSDAPSGGETTLDVRVNRLLWHEVDTLYGRGPRERVYITQIADDGTTTVQFGDGRTGARLPSGSENVEATYRKGIGREGLVDAGQLSLLITRPLGVKSVVNPLAPAGAQDPQVIDDARENSPVTVLTLDRIVSLRDYEDFARAFAGIGKALATWTWTGQTRRVFVTVAGIDGAPVDDGSVLQRDLLAAMLKAGDPFVPITVKSCREIHFKVVADLRVDPDFIAADVVAAVEAALRASFSFHTRGFGQAVTLSEVIAVMQDVRGVVSVDINKLHRTDQFETRNDLLPSSAPQPAQGARVRAAELLTLDAGPVELAVRR